MTWRSNLPPGVSDADIEGDWRSRGDFDRWHWQRSTHELCEWLMDRGRDVPDDATRFWEAVREEWNREQDEQADDQWEGI